MLAEFLIDTFVFVLGVCAGSFLNCAIYRLEQKERIAGRSRCPHCKNTLSWRDLFPVFSFLCLRGKCRYCKGKISWQYPIVEISTGLMFLLIFLLKVPSRSTFWVFQVISALDLAFLFYAASALIIIFVYDLKYYIIPDKVLLPAIIITFLYRILEFGFAPSFDGAPGRMTGWISATLLSYILAAAIASGFFLLIFLISKGRWIGFGDVKLAVLMGLLLGLPNILVALFLAFFFGAIIGTMMMVFKGKKLRSEIPFGPFLITGTFVALLWGSQIMDWYMHLFLI